MARKYNGGYDYTIKERLALARSVSRELIKFQSPFSLNSETKIYDRENNSWKEVMLHVLYEILNADQDYKNQ